MIVYVLYFTSSQAVLSNVERPNHGSLVKIALWQGTVPKQRGLTGLFWCQNAVWGRRSTSVLFSTGVLLVDSRDYGVWLMHSTPHFPYKKNRDAFWPSTGANNAQTFVCVTIHYNQFQFVGKVPTQRSLKETQGVTKVLKSSMLISFCPQVNIYSTSRLTHLTTIFPLTSTEH